MSESTGLPPGDPLSGTAIAGRWSFGYDMPDDLGGGFVCGELCCVATASCCAATAASLTAPGRSPGSTGHGTRCPGGPAKRTPSKPSHS